MRFAPSVTLARTAQAFVGLLIASSITYSCVERPDEEEPIDPVVRETLESAATCVMNHAEAFLDAAKTLETKTGEWAGTPEDLALLEEAQVAWTDAMLVWHQMEPMAFGPAGSSSAVADGGAVGGKDLRDLIYSWPLINSCRIDQVLENRAYEDALDEEPVNAQGLDAIEYLLFYDAPESSCLETTRIVADGLWDAIDDLESRRATYAHAAAQLVKTHAESLKNAWDPDDEDFYSKFVEAGESGPFESQKAALNAIVDGIFFIEALVKDQKLAVPLAISESCTMESCPDAIEHQFSGLSKEGLRQNLIGLETLFDGCGGDPTGLEKLLEENGADLKADELLAAIQGVHEALDAIEEADLVEALSEDPDSVNDLYDAIKTLTDLLKNDLVEVLDVELPNSVGGDND